jgi:hypothetical protein
MHRQKKTPLLPCPAGCAVPLTSFLFSCIIGSEQRKKIFGNLFIGIDPFCSAAAD